MASTPYIMDAAPSYTKSGGSPTNILDAQTATIDESGSVNDNMSAGSTAVELISVDKIKHTVTINCLSPVVGLSVGDYCTALVLTTKSRADGKGTTGSALTKTYAYAVVQGKGSGPVIEGSPSYSITFGCKPVAWV